MKRLVLALTLAGAAFAAFALPTLDEVQAEIGKGNYVHAEEMMREVVAAKPGSARAHYVYAEILAHDRRFDQAAEQVARAKAIDPALAFTQPDRFRAFEQLLQREQAAAARAPVSERSMAAPLVREAPVAEHSRGIPGWVWVLGLLAIAAFLWRGFSRSRAISASAPYSGALAPAGGMPMGPSMGGGYGPSYGPAPSAGSGLLGTGLAVAGGVAAGMLAEKLLDGRHGSDFGAAAPGLRGLDAGLLDDSGADAGAQRELEQRPIDFGTPDGSNDGWGGGDGGGGDSGSSGGDGGW